MQGVAGSHPSVPELMKALQSHALFVYFGHGSGEQYLPLAAMRSMRCCAANLLMGCSSGRLRPHGEYEPAGAVLSYIAAGCPAVVANLWDVTDRDIDRFSQTLLRQWLGPRAPPPATSLNSGQAGGLTSAGAQVSAACASTRTAGKARPKAGKARAIWYGSRPWVMVGKPEVGRRLLSRLMIRPSVKFVALLDNETQPMNDLSLIGLKGPAWRVARKAFESAIMHKDALALHLECVARLLARLARITAAGGGDGAIVNVAPLMGDLTMDVVGSCAFGVAFNTQEKELGKAALLGADGQDLGSQQQCLPFSPEELVDACHNAFATSKVGGQSRWTTLALLLPEWCYEGLSPATNP
ncbi:separase [Haematococcus lacustris]|uniref:separase n=1 Tax=Haematococcus lacustris TaxID=44745 RepID=A0A699ZB65_HAELA|nr:separase [Haematococcus lacustris]